MGIHAPGLRRVSGHSRGSQTDGTDRYLHQGAELYGLRGPGKKESQSLHERVPDHPESFLFYEKADVVPVDLPEDGTEDDVRRMIVLQGGQHCILDARKTPGIVSLRFRKRERTEPPFRYRRSSRTCPPAGLSGPDNLLPAAGLHPGRGWRDCRKHRPADQARPRQWL